MRAGRWAGRLFASVHVRSCYLSEVSEARLRVDEIVYREPAECKLSESRSGNTTADTSAYPCTLLPTAVTFPTPVMDLLAMDAPVEEEQLRARIETLRKRAAPSHTGDMRRQHLHRDI